MTSPDCVSVPLCCGWWREQWQCMTGGLWWHSLLYSPHSLLSPHSAILNSVLRWSAGAMPECQWVRARPAGPAVGPVQGFSSISEFDWVQAARPHSGGHSHTLSLSLSAGPGTGRQRSDSDTMMTGHRDNVCSQHVMDAALSYELITIIA